MDTESPLCRNPRQEYGRLPLQGTSTKPTNTKDKVAWRARVRFTTGQVSPIRFKVDRLRLILSTLNLGIMAVWHTKVMRDFEQQHVQSSAHIKDRKLARKPRTLIPGH